MNLAVLYSGGKDSNYSLYLASKYHKISCLLNIIPENNESYLYHYININITKLQSKALEIPLEIFYVNKDEEKTLEDALKYLKEKYNVEGVVTGAIRSIYQATRFQKICKKLNLWCFNPLWLKNEKEYLFELLKSNFKFIITGWYTYPLDINILGKEVNEEIINKLIEYGEKYKINIAGEGGEYETTVLYQPMFKKKIIIDEYEINVEKNYAEYIIKKAHLE
jgi:ABC transporter with metal-binding/Fe-S-binding domain ATP-binding protein